MSRTTTLALALTFSLPMLAAAQDTPDAGPQAAPGAGPAVELPDATPPAPRVEPPDATPQRDALSPDDPLARALHDNALALGSNTTIGGYGEVVFTDVFAPGADGQANLDLARFVLFFSHRFTDTIRFYSELEIEHAVASSEDVGEVEIEQAFVEWDALGKGLSLRAGLVLVPMGIVNQWHEPPAFLSATRPMVDQIVIPTTWREGGIGIAGRPLSWLRYELYVASALNPTGFGAEQGIRDGHQELAFAAANGWSVFGRVEVEPTLGMVAGVSGYASLAGPNARLFDAMGSGAKLSLDVPVLGASADWRWKWKGLEARAVGALFAVGDTARLRGALDADGNVVGPDAGSLIYGVYGEVGFDVLSLVRSDHALVPWVRVERYDTLAGLDGRVRDPGDRAFASTDVAFGLTWRPIPQLAVKADVVVKRSDLPATPATTVVEGALGYMF